MVDQPWAAQEIVDSVRQHLPESQKVLVTGASGFIGARLSNVLAAAGHQVTGAARNPYRAARHPDVRFETADLRDASRISELCNGKQIVFHAGANCSPWGDYQTMYDINVVGTRNVLEGCREHDARMIHVSSTAVFFDDRDRPNLDDNAAWAKKHRSAYAATKAKAEDAVREWAPDVNVSGVRARAVFGPGDNSLLPQIVGAAEQGRLRIIGSGNNVIDLTYVDNLLHGLVLAAARADRGEILTVTNDEPVALWPYLERILRRLGVLSHGAKLRRIPHSIAMLAAQLSQWNHQWRRSPGEPALTKYGVGLVSHTQTFDIGRAKQRWGYRPIVSMEEGLARTVEHWLATTPAAEVQAAAPVKLRIFSTGFTTARKDLVERGASRVQVRLHASVALIEHPVHGKLLLDTGYAPRVLESTRKFPFQLYRWLTPVHTSDKIAARRMLTELNVDPAEIRCIILSHFHADHVGGLLDFPHADVIATKAAWESTQYKGFGALRRGVLPDLQPRDLPKQLYLLEEFHDPGLGPFRASHDFFGDGSLRLFYLLGHAAGQMGALAVTDAGPIFLVADAAWTKDTLEKRLPLTWAFRKIAVSVKDATATQAALHELVTSHPEIQLAPTHCPEVAAEWGLDRQLAAVDSNFGPQNSRNRDG